MTKEEAIEILQEEHDWCQEPSYVIKAIEVAITALRTVSREQVEKMWKTEDDSPHEKGRWFHCTNCNYGCDDYYSHDEKQMPNNNFQFCPCCGKAVTDEAVEMVMERLEEVTSE